MDEARVKEIVTEFTQEYLDRHLIWQLGQIIPGADGWVHDKMPRQIHAGNLQYTLQPQEWLAMARYGAGLMDADAGEMQEVCQSMAEWLFAIPGYYAYSIPSEWAKTDMGALWWAAHIRAIGDELITIIDAAALAGVSVQAISARIDRGTLLSFTDPAANQRQGKRLVRRSDIIADGLRPVPHHRRN